MGPGSVDVFCAKTERKQHCLVLLELLLFKFMRVD